MTARPDQLRAAFDRDFAAPLRPPEPQHSDVLCIRVAGQPHAIRLADMASLHAELRVIALPTRAPELLGVAAIRTAVVPIYDIALALGMASAAALRWTVVHREGRAGFAFESYDGHVRIAEGSISAARRGHIAGQVTVSGQPRSVIDLGSLLVAIEARWNPGGTAKER